jgi:uncharacterized protein (TIGR02452 family)
MGLRILPCVDSAELAAARRAELALPHERAAALGRTAVLAAMAGHHDTEDGRQVDWKDALQAALAARRSLPPDAPLPPWQSRFQQTVVGVTNETTLGAARRLADAGLRPLALNFANGVHPGGGFLSGALAQEEVLCRCSALFLTLHDDAMYEAHRPRPDVSSDWAILSPDVPVFRRDDGTALARPWLLSFLTCAAPYAPSLGQPRAGDLLQQRIGRVLAIAAAHGFETLVLGAWGCGAFANDPVRTARDFRSALEGAFAGAFREVVFAIADWSPERRFLGPFRDVFAP